MFVKSVLRGHYLCRFPHFNRQNTIALLDEELAQSERYLAVEESLS
jgi:hypothetical protein